LPLTDESDGLRDQDACPDGQVSGQTAALLKYQSDITQDTPRKRKHSFEGSRDSKRMHVEATDATEVELGSRSLQRSGPLGLWFTPNQSERHNQQDEISQAGQDSCLSVAAVTSPAPGAAQPILNSGNIPLEEGSPTQHQIAMPQEVPFLLSSTARCKYIYEAFANTHSTLLKIAKKLSPAA